MNALTVVPPARIDFQAQVDAARQRREDLTAVAVLVGWSLFYQSLVFPYSGMHLGQQVMAMCGIVLVGMGIKFALENLPCLLLMFVAYAPYQKALPGDFAYFMRAFNMTNALLVLVVGAWIGQAAVAHRQIYRRKPVDIALLLFIFLSCTSMVFGDVRAYETWDTGIIFNLKRWVTPMAIYYIFANALRTRRDLKLVMAAVMLGVGLIALRGVKEWYFDKGGLFGSYFGNIDRARVTGQMDNPNQFGAFLCYYSFYFAAMFLVFHRLKKAWWLLIPFLLCGRAMLLTFSRGTTLAFTVASCYLVWLYSKRLFFLALVPVLIYFTVNPEDIPGILVGRFRTTFVPVQSVVVHEDQAGSLQVRLGDVELDRSSVGRLLIWKFGLEMVRENPMLGVGFGRFRQEIQYLTGGRYDSHNTYLTIAAEMGVPALLLFLLILYQFYRSAQRVRKGSRDLWDQAFVQGYLAGLMGLAVANIFGFRLNSNELVFYFFIASAVLARLDEIIADEREAEAARVEAAFAQHQQLLGVSP